jgi:hypothetical protein
VDIDLREALVAPVASQAADRLAPASEQDESAESGHDRERDDAAPETASDPQGDEHDDAQRERERRQEPP